MKVTSFKLMVLPAMMALFAVGCETTTVVEMTPEPPPPKPKPVVKKKYTPPPPPSPAEFNVVNQYDKD